MKKILTLFTALLLLGSFTVVKATDYYYRGNQNGWGATIMTTSTDGYYAYYSANSYANNGNQNNNFKISTSTGSWNYNSSYVTRGFNNTDIAGTSGNKSIGTNWDGDNVCIYCTSNFYILIYFPNTAINTTNNPIICASTTLPDDSSADPFVSLGTMPSSVGKGETLTFSNYVSSENVSNPTYTYYVKKGTGSYGSAVTSYTFAETGTYTVKVEVRQNGTGSALDTDEKTITCNPVYTVYFKNTPGWSNVYVHLYPAGQIFGDNGVGGQSAEINAAMTKIDDGPYWKYQYNSATKYTKVCFTKEAQNDYGNFWQNECSWSDGLDFDNNLVLWIPNTGSSTTINSTCTYYNTGNWSVYPPLVPGVAFNGVPTNVYYGQEVTFAATSENVSNPTYTFKVKQGEGEYGDAVSSYTFNAAGSYTVKVEVRSNGAGDALATAEQAITCTKYSLMKNNHNSSDKGEEVAVLTTTNGTTFTANWTCPSAGTYYFYASKDASSSAHENCDYLNGSQTFTDGSNIQVYLYGNATGCYDHSFTLNAPRAGQYTFTLTLGEPIYFKCDYPEPPAYSVEFDGLADEYSVGQSVTLAATPTGLTNVSYEYQVKIGEGDYAIAANPYTFAAAGSYTFKVIATGDEGDAWATKIVTCKRYSLMKNNHNSSDKGEEVAVLTTTNGTTFTANWTCPSAGTYYFYASKDASSSAHENCDYLNGSQTFTDGSNIQVYLYGNATGCYNHSFTLNAPRAGQYTFTLTLGDPIYFKCDYPEALDAEVDLDALPSVAYKDDAFTLANYVASVNVVQPEYTFFVKKGDADYGSAVASYTFAETGTYTVKAEVREQGAGGDALDDVEKSITIYEEPLTLYFVNKEGWSDIHAYVYGDGDIKNAPWPGELMTATGDETDRNHYAVYSVVVPKDIYTTAIFNNSESGFPDNQTGNMTIDNTKPYYYDGDWYATLAECDQPVLTTHYYLVGSFNSWNTTADRFMKATEDATTASVTISVSEYSNIEFKVIENGSWTGAAEAIDKDHTSITLANAGSGDNVSMTPYAAGDYIFTLDLSTRELTVTYPSGDPMPVPTNFYLAGTFNGWSTTADRFVKASPDATTASVTINIAEYINITMKVMEGSAYCGGATAIDKDNTSVTIAAAGQGNDIAMTPYAAGDYIFTFDLSTRELTVTYPSGDPMPIPQNIYLLGIESWDESDDYKFSVSGDVATLEVENMTALHEYEFKLKYNGAWFGANYDFKYYWCSDVVFSAGADNAKLYTFKDGTYTFTLKISTMELTIGFPPTAATSVSVSQYEYATLYSDKALDVPNEVEAFVVTGHEGIRLTLEPIYRIPANTGVLLHAPQGTYNFYEGDGRYIDPVAVNLLKGSVADELIDNSLIHYVLSYNNDFQVGFYWPFGTGATQGVGAFTNNAGKAYLELPDQPASVVARQGFTFVNTTDSTTGLEDVTTEGESVKVLRNGMLLIIHNGQVFNAQGARVQ